MISPKRFHPFKWGIPGMDRVVHSAVHKISQYKSGEKYEGVFFHSQVHDSEYRRRNNDTRNRRHKQTLFVSGKMMMIPMHHIDEFLGPFTIRNGMKCKTMHQVLEKGPEKTSGQKIEENTGITEIQLKMTQIDKVYNHRYIHPPNHQRVGFRQHFHITVTEKLGLPLIMNLFKLHFTGFMLRK
jgi:hypothetical protein